MADENNNPTNPTNQTEPAPASNPTEPTSTTPTEPTEPKGGVEGNNNPEPSKTEGNQEDLGSNKDPKEGSDEGKNPSTPEVVDDKTEFKIPDGMTLDSKKMDAFRGIAKELKLTKEQAQKLVDFDAQNIQGSDKAFKDLQASWKAETMKQLGENAEQKLGEAAAAYKQFGDDEFVKLMKDTGLENHPAVVRVFRNIGSKIAVDKTVSATSNGVKSTMTFEEALYGKK